MAKGGSSKMEKKARAAKKMLKKSHRRVNKKKRSDDHEDEENVVTSLHMPTPAQHRELDIDDDDDVDDGRIGKKRKKKKKSPDDVGRHTQVSLRHLPTPNFSNCDRIEKVFIADWIDRAPVGDELKLLRKSIAVNVKGSEVERCPPPFMNLDDTLIPDTIRQVFVHLGHNKLTTVQMQCWPAVLAGLNILAISPTGSGKTFAYGFGAIPHLMHQIDLQKGLQSGQKSPVGLVLVPTRELAIQVAAALKPIKKLFSIRAVPIYGGQEKEVQLNALEDYGAPHVIVATPGRLLDLVAAKKIRLDKISYFVLDEADRMLNMGFFEQLDAISKQIRPDRQTLLFSATFPGRLRDAAATWVQDAIVIRCSTFDIERASEFSANSKEENQPSVDGVSLQLDSLVPSSSSQMGLETSREADSAYTISRSVKQQVHICAAHKKPRLLIKYLERIRADEKISKVRQPGSVLVFCTKIKTLNFVAEFLKKQGIRCEIIHGQLPQHQRERALNDFKAGKANVLVATDIAARGIHIRKLQYVINYDFPTNLDQYCHRIGRSGRQGEVGTSYSLITRNMAPMAADLITLLKSCGQEIEPNLSQLAIDYSLGLVDLAAEEQNDARASTEAVL